MLIIPKNRTYIKPQRASHVAGQMNKLEEQYSHHLKMRKLAGEILDYRFEAMAFTLCHNVPGKRNKMTYTPDFLVLTTDCFELHEVKGFWEEDAWNKIKMAAELFPWFRWFAVQRDKKMGNWKTEEF